MISNKEFMCIKSLLETEKSVTEEYEKLLKSASEPQLKTEFQNIISSTRNHTGILIKYLEENNEN